MITISIDEIKRDLVGYLQRVRAGETILVLQADKPIAEIKPIVSDSGLSRPFGLCAGEFVVPDDFDEPLLEDTVQQFESR